MTHQNDPHSELLESLRNKQSNTRWPDALRNGRSVDEVLFKGSPDAPLVQRIGIAVFAFAYIVIGVAMVLTGIEHKSAIFLIAAALMFLLGGKFLYSVFWKRKKSENPS